MSTTTNKLIQDFVKNEIPELFDSTRYPVCLLRLNEPNSDELQRIFKHFIVFHTFVIPAMILVVFLPCNGYYFLYLVVNCLLFTTYKLFTPSGVKEIEAPTKSTVPPDVEDRLPPGIAMRPVITQLPGLGSSTSVEKQPSKTINKSMIIIGIVCLLISFWLFFQLQIQYLLAQFVWTWFVLVGIHLLVRKPSEE
jgi:hypothetical protein